MDGVHATDLAIDPGCATVVLDGEEPVARMGAVGGIDPGTVVDGTEAGDVAVETEAGAGDIAAETEAGDTAVAGEIEVALHAVRG